MLPPTVDGNGDRGLEEDRQANGAHPALTELTLTSPGGDEHTVMSGIYGGADSGSYTADDLTPGTYTYTLYAVPASPGGPDTLPAADRVPEHIVASDRFVIQTSATSGQLLVADSPNKRIEQNARMSPCSTARQPRLLMRDASGYEWDPRAAKPAGGLIVAKNGGRYAVTLVSADGRRYQADKAVMQGALLRAEAGSRVSQTSPNRLEWLVDVDGKPVMGPPIALLPGAPVAASTGSGTPQQGSP